jgi:small subunit ribosomal protein S16
MIRLARVGARKQPHYRVVVIEKDRARNGRSVEVVGTYNPRTNPATVSLKRDRIDFWTGNGAQLSDRVGKLMAQAPTPEPEPSPNPVVTGSTRHTVPPCIPKRNNRLNFHSSTTSLS